MVGLDRLVYTSFESNGVVDAPIVDYRAPSVSARKDEPAVVRWAVFLKFSPVLAFGEMRGDMALILAPAWLRLA